VDSRVGDAPSLETAFPTKSQLLRGGSRSLRDLDFSLYAFAALPRTIRDAEGELSRAGEFERCFPTSDPDLNARYLELFETRRHENALLCAWERHKKALRGRKPANVARELNKNAKTSRSAPARSAPKVSRLAPRGDERPPLGSARASNASNASSRSSPHSSPPPNAGAAADVDALASSLARRLGVTSGRLRDARFETRFETPDSNRLAFARDAVRSVGARGSSEKTKRTIASTLGISAPLAVKGEGRKKAAVPESVLARARRR
jgi:hypothetical protein